MAYFNHSQMFAQLNKEDNAEKSDFDQQIKDGYQQIQLHEIGESSLPPDKIRCIITCFNVKETVEAATQSVARRLDYITQTLRNNSVKEECYKIHQLINREEEGGYKMHAEVVIQFPSVEIYLTTINFLVEKLDNSIKVSKPLLYHSEGSLSNLRRQASLNAVRNCRTKALSMAQYLNQTIGPAVLIQETECTEHSALSNTCTDSTLLTLQEEIELRTVSAAVKVYMVFKCDDRKKKVQRK